MPTNAYETIIWDWNGTLLDDVELAIQVMNQMLQQANYPTIGLETYRTIFDFPVRIYYERAGFDLAQHNFEQLADRFCREFENGLDAASLFAEATSTIAGLGELNHFVLSNTEHSALQRMLTRFELNQAFTAIQGMSHNTATGKVGIGKTLIATHNLNPATTLLVGDTTHDAEVAQALNTRCLLIATGHHSQKRLQATGAPVVNSLAAARQFIQGARGAV